MGDLLKVRPDPEAEVGAEVGAEASFNNIHGGRIYLKGNLDFVQCTTCLDLCNKKIVRRKDAKSAQEYNHTYEFERLTDHGCSSPGHDTVPGVLRDKRLFVGRGV